MPARVLSRVLAAVHRDGFALDDEEVIEGVVCVGVAIPRRTNADPHLAICITLLKPRATEPLLAILAAELKGVAAAISLGLGQS